MRRAKTSSLRDIRSIRSAGIRSIPKVQRSPYLELYMLSGEKDRLAADTILLDNRRKTAKKQLKSLDRRIEKLQGEISEKQRIKLPINIPHKPIKRMAIHY